LTVPERFYIETLGCPKNQVDSEKLVGALLRDGMEASDEPESADLVVVNTCAFIEAARTESIDAVLALDERRAAGSRLVVTGCMAERYGAELAAALPEVDQVAGFGIGFTGPAPPATVPARKLIPVRTVAVPAFDLLNLPRPRSAVPWAYVKIAEGCDHTCAFCAIPSFRGTFRSRDPQSVVREATSLARAGVREINLFPPLRRCVDAQIDRQRFTDQVVWLVRRGCASGPVVLELSSASLLGGLVVYALVYMFGFITLRYNWAFLWYMLNMFSTRMIGFITAAMITSVVAAGLTMIVNPPRK
jgi:hypothetical protein